MHRPTKQQPKPDQFDQTTAEQTSTEPILSYTRAPDKE